MERITISYKVILTNIAIKLLILLPMYMLNGIFVPRITIDLSKILK